MPEWLIEKTYEPIRLAFVRVPVVTLRTVVPEIVLAVSVAAIVVIPRAAPVAVLPLIVAAVVEEVQVDSAVQSDVEVLVPLVNVPKAVNAFVPPTAMAGPFGDTASPVSWSTDTVAVPVFVLSLARVAVTVIGPGLVTGFGAVYRPEVESMLPGAVEGIDQVTAAVELVTTAVNWSVPPGTTVDEAADAVMVTVGGVIVPPPFDELPPHAAIPARAARTRLHDPSLEHIGTYHSSRTDPARAISDTTTNRRRPGVSLNDSPTASSG